VSASGDVLASALEQRRMPLRPYWPAVACLLIAAASGWMSLRLVPGNVDVSWLLVVCDRLLDGAQLHVDIVEVNPPFSIWLYMPFAVLGRLTTPPAEFWLAIGLPALALTSVAFSARILMRAGLVDRRASWLAPAALAVLLLLFPADFGQREQFAVLALLPWLSLLAARDADPELEAGTVFERVVAGLGAAVFVIIKPPMSVPALAIPALFVCFDRRSLRAVFTTETLVGAAVTFAYLGWIAVFHLRFFLDLMPLLREFYLPARMGVAEMLTLWPITTLVGLFMVAAMAAMPKAIDKAPAILFLAAAGYAPAFIMMGKGWTYQAMPCLMLGLLGFLLQVAKLQTTGMTSALSKGGVAAGLVLAAFIAFSEGVKAYEAASAEIETEALAIRAVLEKPSVGSIATRLQPAHPLTRMVEGTYVSRQPSMWVVANAQTLIDAAGEDSEKGKRLARERDDFIAEAAADLALKRPDLIFDSGSEPTPGQKLIHATEAIQSALRDYRVLYQDRLVTIFIRSDLTSGSPAAISSSP